MTTPDNTPTRKKIWDALVTHCKTSHEQNKAEGIVADPTPDENTTLRRELEEAKKRIVSGFYEEHYPQYRQGHPIHELESEATAEECNGLVDKLKKAEAENAKLREQVDGYKKELKGATEYKVWLYRVQSRLIALEALCERAAWFMRTYEIGDPWLRDFAELKKETK